LPNQTTYRFTYTTAIVYEIVKLWQASGKRARHAFLGEPAFLIVRSAGISLAGERSRLDA
jgi:hypothetical protein